jgi:metal-dependent amidase/aminoacylase/carboxypeptidase family protein
MLRSPDQAYYEEMKARFGEIARGAALAAGTSVELTFSGGAKSMHQNRTLEARWVENADAYGIVDGGPDPNSGSTDMANVSWVCPTIHPELSIADAGTPGHSILFRDAAATPKADETTLLAATLVAQVAAELYADPELVAAAWREFHVTKPTVAKG